MTFPLILHRSADRRRFYEDLCSPLSRRPIKRSYANSSKEKERSDLAFARRGPRLFLVRQLMQHAQRLEHGPIANLGTADITVFPVMRNDVAAAGRRAEIDETNWLAGYGASWPCNTCN